MSRRHILAALTALPLHAALLHSAIAQVAFVPQISSFPSGVGLSVTPVVSVDRRYVRMTLNPQFTAIEGFDTAPVPGAVSGGGIGGGGLGGGGVAGFRSVVAGMEGEIGPEQMAYGNGPEFYPTASPYASSVLSGDAWPSERPRLAPVPDDMPRPKAKRRSARSTRTKRFRSAERAR